jgi:uncharacterized protein
VESVLTALALIFVLEGLLPFCFPKGWRKIFEQVLKLSDGQIRFYGLGSIVAGLVLMWLVG